MGRTVVPARYEIDAQLDELKRYVRCLRKEEVESFDKIYAQIKKHISSISYSNPLNPAELMQWAALIEMQKDISRLSREADRHFPK